MAGEVSMLHDRISQQLLEKNGISFEDAVANPTYLNDHGYELIHKRLADNTYEFVLTKIVDKAKYDVQIKYDLDAVDSKPAEAAEEK